MIADEVVGFLLAYVACLTGEKYVSEKKVKVGHCREVDHYSALIVLISFGMVYPYVP
ncbi:MAG: hypothetical protein ACTSR0_06055 [Candidatus Asgardarchaeia archaeon]